MAAAEPEKTLAESLTPYERNFVLKQRVAECLSEVMHTVVHPAWTQSYLTLCNGDTALMAMHYGRCRSLMAIAQIFFQPIAAAASDRFGRRHMMTWVSTHATALAHACDSGQFWRKS